MGEIESRLGKILREAEFDPKLKVYWLLSGSLIFVITIIGLPLLPFWLLLGPLYCGKKFKSLESKLTEKALIVRAGVMIRVEQTVPLDRIQDLTLTEGPLLKAFGLCSIRVETAGAVTTAGGGGAGLVGVVDAREFRNAVLDQREVVAGSGEASGAARLPASGAGAATLLAEIRDSLLRIEERLKER